MFSNSMKNDLIWAMKESLLSSSKCNDLLTEDEKKLSKNFILNEATYEQLLNLVYNPGRSDLYLSQDVLENVALYSLARSCGLKDEIYSLKESAAKTEKVPVNSFDGKFKILETVLSKMVGERNSNISLTELRESSKNSGTVIKGLLGLCDGPGKNLLEAGRVVIEKKLQSGSVTAAAIETSAAMVYKKSMTRLTKPCNKKDGEDKKACIKNAKINSMKSVISMLEKDKGRRSKNDPSASERYTKKINNWKTRLNSIK